MARNALKTTIARLQGRSNDHAHLTGPLQEVEVARKSNAAPVTYSAWFGASVTLLSQSRKGGKYLEIPAHHKSVECLDAYIAAAGIAEQKGTPLFRALDNHRRITERPLTPKKALQMMKRRAKQAGLPADTCCHTWRGTGITDYLRAGGLLEEAQKRAGHATVRTTNLYNRLDDAVTIDEVEKMPSFDARPVG